MAGGDGDATIVAVLTETARPTDAGGARPPDATAPDAGAGPGGAGGRRRGGAADDRPPAGAWARRAIALGAALAPPLALVLWAVGLRAIDLDRIDDRGLISALPPVCFAALAVLIAGLVAELSRRAPRRWVLGASVAAAVLVVHATTPLLYGAPRYTYVYKHIAVTRYVAEHGSVSRPIEIYQNWTGFPALFAYLSSVTGLDPMSYAAWAQPAFAAGNVLAARFALRAFTRDVRVLGLALWVYVLTDWIGQNYFAPQALAFLCSLLAVGVILRALPSSTVVGGFVQRGPFRRLRRWAARRVAAVTQPLPVVADSRLSSRGATVLTLALLAVVVLSHPLSPYLVLTWLVALVVLGRWRLWWMPVVVGIAALAWTTAAQPWLGTHVNLFADVGLATKNVQGTASAATLPPSPDHELVVRAARLLSIGTWLVAGVGAWRWWRAGRRDLTPLALVVAPFVLVLGQSYGGEAIYRVFLFTAPFCSLLVATLLLGPAPVLRPWRRPVLAVALAGLTLVFLLAYFGLERINRVLPEEVAASEWFEQHAPAGSVLTVIGPSFPIEVSADYDRYRSPWGTWGATLIGDDPTYTGRELTDADVPGALDHLRTYAGTDDIYIALTPGQEAYTEMFGLAPDGAVTRFGQLLQRRPEVEEVWRSGDSVILKVHPPAPAPAAQPPPSAQQPAAATAPTPG